ncbi:transient receptor potential cation channel subfamily a member [Anaeramoeba flamelloides]|uniref:Transient receptor potential cation channel subfamily a member n=1 Tax=Anaeramoeba flamelloides TaxID=1746091 RepID=A0AAV7ZK17_9EUKA|nr:transient receptor potential cation channel subfamily a member [Anaeramoeba flamelloides]
MQLNLMNRRYTTIKELSATDVLKGKTANELNTYFKKNGVQNKENDFLYTALYLKLGKEIFQVLFQYRCHKYMNEGYQCKNFLSYALEQAAPLDLVKYFISKGANPKLVNPLDSSTLLHECVKYKLGIKYFKYFAKFLRITSEDGNENTVMDSLTIKKFEDLEIIEFLIDHLQDINFKNKDNDTLLHLACQNSNPNLDLIQKMINNGIKIDLVNCEGKQAFSYLITSDVSMEVIQFFLNKKQNINEFAEYSTTLLMGVCKNKEEYIEYCLKNGADAKLLNSFHESALYYLLQNKNSKLKHFQLFKDYGAPFDCRNYKAETVLDLALKKRQEDLQILEFLIQNTNLKTHNKKFLDPLAIALRKRLPLTIIKCIIENGGDCNKVNVFGEHSLFHATTKKRLINHKIIEYLVKEKGVKFDFRNKKRLFPLQQAIKNPFVQLKTIKLLVNSRMNINKCYFHQPFCHLLAKNTNLKTEAWDFFIDLGMDIYKKSKHSNSNLLSFTIKHKRFDIFKYLVKMNLLDVNQINKDQETPVSLACSMGLTKYLKLMDSQSPDYNHKNKIGNSCLHNALFINKGLCKYLILKGVNVNTQNMKKTTPLHLVLLHSLDLKFLKLLLKNGADHSILDERGLTPIHKLFFEPSSQEICVMKNVNFKKPYLPISKQQKDNLKRKDVDLIEKYLNICTVNGIDLKGLPGRNLITYLLEYKFPGKYVYRLILENGYDPNYIDKNNHFDNDDINPLLYLCQHLSTKFHLLNILLIYGADLECEAKNGLTPMVYIGSSHFKKHLAKFKSYQNDFLNLYRNQIQTDLEINGIKINRLFVETRIGMELDEKNIQTLEKHPAKYLNWFFEWIYSGFETHYSAYKLKRIKRICYTLGFYKQFQSKSRKKGLQTDLYSLFKNNLESDFTLIIGEEKLHLHKFVLAARSNLFRELFKFTSGNENVDQIHDYTKSGFRSIKIIIKFLYTDKIHLKESDKIDLIMDELEYIYDYYQLNENCLFFSLLDSERKRLVHRHL